MLKTSLIHPEIVGALAACGHGDKVLIADGNYPIASDTNSNTRKIYLGLSGGIPTVPDVLRALIGAANFERAEVMTPGGEEAEPEVFVDFRDALQIDELSELDRFAFYDEVKGADNVKLAISTGELRVFSNILLTVGVR